METITEYQQALMQAFGFDENDLRTNRAGEITPKQLKRVEDDYYIFKVVLAITTVVIIGVGLALASSNAVNLLIAVLISLALNIGIYFLPWLLKNLRVAGDTYDKQVDSVCGRLHLTKDVRALSNPLTAAIWGLSFPLTENQFKLLKDGDEYCIYYTLNAQTLLSIEWLREGEHIHL